MSLFAHLSYRDHISLTHIEISFLAVCSQQYCCSTVNRKTSGVNISTQATQKQKCKLHQIFSPGLMYRQTKHGGAINVSYVLYLD